MKLTEIIRRPLVTEKTTTLRDDGKTVVFEVSKDANKVDIKRAIEKLLGAKVADITRLGEEARVTGSMPSPAWMAVVLTPLCRLVILFMELPSICTSCNRTGWTNVTRLRGFAYCARKGAAFDDLAGPPSRAGRKA